MLILSNTGGIAQTNSFLIADESTGDAVLFDAPDHTVAPLLAEAKKRNLNLIGLWLTHGHFDHIADHALVSKAFPNAKVLMHQADEEMLQRASMQSELFGLPFIVPDRSVDGYLADKQQLQIGKLKLEAMHTPGHAPGHIAFYFPEEKVLVGGDLIIAGSVGRTDLPGADPRAFVQSLQRVMELPPETKLLPGHGKVSTLGDEAKRNMALGEILG
ncbi:MAG TPA: MBL fold metallo-hydrolase [Tepidisphaeraceae bacterium]|jgi:glyoxylase-like metal-dependent hydrolase (beta-lactamase superfamily II)